jgi:hypothetical protein
LSQDRVRNWALRFVPDKADEETRTKRIRVSTETTILDTWDAPFAGRDSWCEEMEALLSCTADQLPIRRHGITFTAEDAAGNVLSQCLTSVQGKNKEVADLGGTNGVKALADAMNSIASTADKVLATARLQCDSLGKTVAALSDEVQDLHNLARAQRAKDTVAGEDGESAEITKMAFAKLEEYGPQILELGRMYLEVKGATPSATATQSPAVRSIVQAVTATNGKAAS